MDDKKLARKIQRAPNAVRLRRRALGIPIHNSSRHTWSREDEKLLGKRPDHEVAMLIGATLKAVLHRRSQLGISPCAQQLRQARLGRASSSRARQRGGHCGLYTAAEDKLLGTMPDAQLAEKLGRSFGAIQARRILKQIPKFDPKLHQWTAAEDALPIERSPIVCGSRCMRWPLAVDALACAFALRIVVLGHEKRKRCWEQPATRKLPSAWGGTLEQSAYNAKS